MLQYSEEVRIKRQIYKKHVDCYKRSTTAENLLELLKAKKEYNIKLKAERRQIKNMKLQALKRAKDSNDSKKYWELIKQNQSKKNEDEPKCEWF